MLNPYYSSVKDLIWKVFFIMVQGSLLNNEVLCEVTSIKGRLHLNGSVMDKG